MGGSFPVNPQSFQLMTQVSCLSETQCFNLCCHYEKHPGRSLCSEQLWQVTRGKDVLSAFGQRREKGEGAETWGRWASPSSEELFPVRADLPVQLGVKFHILYEGFWKEWEKVWPREWKERVETIVDMSSLLPKEPWHWEAEKAYLTSYEQAFRM